jgi:4a-hydroxytetrahydrobiopterin dehydratase
MSDLVRQKCEACRADAPRVADDELPDLLKQIPDWQPVTSDSVLKLNKVFNFENYADATSFTNKIAELAEEEDHHPSPL